MYYDDHNPPHFHAYYNDYEAVIDFDGEIIKGNLPKNQLKLVEAWCIIHKRELETNWLLCKKYKEVFNIQPLE